MAAGEAEDMRKPTVSKPIALVLVFGVAAILTGLAYWEPAGAGHGTGPEAQPPQEFATARPEAEGLGEPLPGAPPIDPELGAELAAKWADRDPDYQPRTRHLRADGSPKYINRLFLESSPYLLQHAHNPVDWYPWGDEAFEVARRSGRPVVLSVGYSTCHWCHVM